MKDIIYEIVDLLGELEQSDLVGIKRQLSNEISLESWIKEGRPVPPPVLYKHQTIREYGEKYGIDTLIETGTYYGGTVWALRNNFNCIISIELGEDLYSRAKKLFADYNNISIVHGDSGNVLPIILELTKTPCLFWLDGHYSAGVTARGEIDSPIIKEVNAILNHPVKNHVILIDDARSFNNVAAGYPDLEKFIPAIRSFRPDLDITVADDIIRIVPRGV